MTLNVLIMAGIVLGFTLGSYHGFLCGCVEAGLKWAYVDDIKAVLYSGAAWWVFLLTIAFTYQSVQCYVR